MKKLLLIVGTSLVLFADILPKNFGQCKAIKSFTANNPPIAIKSRFEEIKQYACQSGNIFVAIENNTEGILKLKENIKTKNFLLKHLTIQNRPAAVYIDYGSKKGEIAIKLSNDKTVVIFFDNSDYQKILNSLTNINLNNI